MQKVTFIDSGMTKLLPVKFNVAWLISNVAWIISQFSQRRSGIIKLFIDLTKSSVYIPQRRINHLQTITAAVSCFNKLRSYHQEK